ncbi:hypothetical protein LOTGIDRAFT_124040 [Lottia gigantea]|uniref:Sulfatase N-terminal domain-containing protein n=1 Tax=Lottia gigantea TaxID=225164 RepID=V3ZFY3_LOTGI|nr:hypothetical protein LOTGIDRAFT_124040 [Lottia gigantea]ESO90113.1 hypothetical protein LOTGIDRAFT_124040 [Lottia gigantea]
MSKLPVVLLLLLNIIERYDCKLPNIVFVVADDLGWYDVGFHGSDVSTPNIDALATNGIILNNYYVSPICTPTRSAIMTGRHPIHTGMQHQVIGNDTPYGLPLNITILPQYLKQQGYNTHIVGKWHLGHFKREYLPNNRGFDSYFGYLTGHEDYFDHVAEGSPSWGKDFRHNFNPVSTMDNQYSTELYSAAADTIIRNHDQSNPLFLYLAHQAVHAGNHASDPLQAPQKYVDRHTNIRSVTRRLFAGMVSALDDAIGNLTQTLKETGMINNTVIVFTTDNGGPTNGYDRNSACNWPLRGCKNTMWEGGVRGNGFIFSPLLNKTGYINNNLMHVTDWLPTLYSISGGDPDTLIAQDGYNQWNMLSNNGSSVRTSVLHNIDPIQKFAAMRSGEYKLIMGDISGGRDDSWYPPPDLKKEESSHMLKFHSMKDNEYVVNMQQPQDDQDTDIIVKCGPKPIDADINCRPEHKPCLYHIPSDPCEYTNIADQHPDIVADIIQQIDKYRKTMVIPANKPGDPKSDPRLHGGFWGPWL